jgi:hypothetical protein
MHDVWLEHSLHGLTQSVHELVESLAYVYLGQLRTHAKFERYTGGFNPARQDVQVVVSLTHAEQLSAQGWHNLSMPTKPGLHIFKHTFPCKYKLMQLVQLIARLSQVAQSELASQGKA